MNLTYQPSDHTLTLPNGDLVATLAKGVTTTEAFTLADRLSIDVAKEIDYLEGKVDVLAGEVSEIAGEADDYEEECANLQGELEDARREIGDLSSENALLHKRIAELQEEILAPKLAPTNR